MKRTITTILMVLALVGCIGLTGSLAGVPDRNKAPGVDFGTYGLQGIRSNHYNKEFPGEANLIGVDEADNRIATAPADKDRENAPGVDLHSYGLQGNWEAGQQ